MANDDVDAHAAFGSIVKKVRTKAEEQGQSLPAPRAPRRATKPVGKQGNGTSMSNMISSTTSIAQHRHQYIP